MPLFPSLILRKSHRVLNRFNRYPIFRRRFAALLARMYRKQLPRYIGPANHQGLDSTPPNGYRFTLGMDAPSLIVYELAIGRKAQNIALMVISYR